MKIEKNALSHSVHQIDLQNTINGGMSLTSLDMEETPESLIIRVNAPTLNSNAYHVELIQNQLMIYTLLDEKTMNESKAQFVVPAFLQSFPISTAIDSEKIEAIYEENQLKVIIPFSKDKEAPQGRKIEIKKYF